MPPPVSSSPGCCPPGWKLFRWRCLWVSDVEGNRQQSQERCKHQRARLLVFKGWDAAAVWEAIGGRGYPQDRQLWIGLTGQKPWKSSWTWSWADGSPYESENKPQVASTYSGSSACATLSQGRLSGGPCFGRLCRYICEKAASPARLV
ncbi:oxidized low-density lipoprotein receptor 1-like [Sphaerodactylus townsendi]|uniref:oxidized low-density lipoprotein receptor 1-like n=1 Tax=Sphaerodactylus townsendi TaxID=933632 RepID=UPI002025DD8F|nr:oxidized low-density lipoprotein receptor 1-like [Sphaerodactylus townsendi]